MYLVNILKIILAQYLADGRHTMNLAKVEVKESIEKVVEKGEKENLKSPTSMILVVPSL